MINLPINAHLNSSNIESYTKNVKPVSQSDTTITYGPYNDIVPGAEEEMSVHFENNNPFLIVERMEREVELSMWGNIAVTETIGREAQGGPAQGIFLQARLKDDI